MGDAWPARLPRSTLMTGGIGLERIGDEACLRTLAAISWPSRKALPRLRRQVLRRSRTDMSIGKSQEGVRIALAGLVPPL
jgi:hypothetical protein